MTATAAAAKTTITVKTSAVLKNYKTLKLTLASRHLKNTKKII